MSREAEPIKVIPDSELAHLLDAAALSPIVLEKDGVRYRINRVDEAAARLDPAASVAGIQAAAGSWKDIDAESFKAYIAEHRRASSRPPVAL